MGSVDQPHGVLVFVASQIYLRESAALCWDSLGSVRPVEWAEGTLSPRPSPQILDRRRAYSLRVSRFGVTLLRGRSLEDGSFSIWSDGPTAQQWSTNTWRTSWQLLWLTSHQRLQATSSGRSSVVQGHELAQTTPRQRL